MQDPILSITSTKRLYSTRGILIGSILAGPIVAGYMMSQNSTALELRDQLRIWLFSIGGFLLITILAIVLPESVPAFLFVFANAAFGYYCAHSLQGKHIEQHLVNGGRVYSAWRSAGIALLFTAILVILALGAFLLADLYSGRL